MIRQQLRRWRRPTLARRMTLTYTLLLTVVLAGVLALVNVVQQRIVLRALNDELQVGERVFHEILQRNTQLLKSSVTALAADFSFRELIASGDAGTMRSALDSYGPRINADRIMLLSLAERIEADSADRHNGVAFPFPALFQQALRDGSASAVVTLDNQTVQMILVPIRAPAVIGLIAVGYVLDDSDARELTTLTGLGVSFLGRAHDANQPAAGDWQLRASTLPPQQAEQLLARLQSGTNTIDYHTQQITLDDETYQLRLTALDGERREELAVLQRSLSAALAPHRQLRATLLGLGAASVLLGVLISVIIAGNITRPLTQLSRLTQRMQGGDYSGELPRERKDEIGELANSFSVMRDTLAQREQQILNLAYQDPLTQLPNRTRFNEELSRQLNESQEALAVILINLDRFTMINNTLGHAIGDRLLQHTGERLRSRLPGGALLARIGGDEFAVIAPGASQSAAMQLAEQFEATLATPFVVGQQPVDVRASMGVALAPAHGREPAALLRCADLALYVAKQGHQHVACFDPGLQPFRTEHLSLLSDLRRAVAENELRLFFQPKVSLRGGDHGWCEALVRWQHPQRGFVPPQDFIPFAEQTGDIRRLTRWVIARALTQLRDWQQHGHHVHVAVNISSRDLLDESLPDYVAHCLADAGVPAAQLGLEITESGFIDNPEQALQLLHRLRALGIALSIDDFGTGYSSLSYLKRLPVQELKIDRAFVMSLQAEGNDAAIVRSTIDLAHNFGMQVVAEGVEEKHQALLLQAWGCDRAQGYHFARPLSAEDYLSWLQHARVEAPI